jgi:hypothetical protein
MSRTVTEVGPGDYVKIGREWKQVMENSAWGIDVTPRNWTVRTTDGKRYGMYDINAYAKDGDERR